MVITGATLLGQACNSELDVASKAQQVAASIATDDLTAQCIFGTSRVFPAEFTVLDDTHTWLNNEAMCC